MTTRRLVAFLGIVAVAALFSYTLVLATHDVLAVAQSSFAESGTLLYALSALLLVACVIGYIPAGVRTVRGRALSPMALVITSALFTTCSLVVVAGTAAWFFFTPFGDLPQNARTVFFTTLIFGALLSILGLRSLVANVRYYRRSRAVRQR
jgi:hypothetical protein